MNHSRHWGQGAFRHKRGYSMIEEMTSDVCRDVASAADILLPIAQASVGWPVEVQAWLIAVRETSSKRAAELDGLLQ